MNLRRAPTSPGEILQKEFLTPLGLTQRELAEHLSCDVKVINRLVNGRTHLSVGIALKLSTAFQTSPEFWLNAQRAVDLYEAAKKVKKLPKTLLKTKGRVSLAAR